MCGQMRANVAFKKCAQAPQPKDDETHHFFYVECLKAKLAKAPNGVIRCPKDGCKNKGTVDDLTWIVHENQVKTIVVEWARMAVKNEEAKISLEHCEKRESIKRLTHKVAKHYKYWTEYTLEVLQNDKPKIMKMAHSYMKKFHRNRVNPSKSTLKNISDEDLALVEKAKAERVARLKKEAAHAHAHGRKAAAGTSSKDGLKAKK